MKVCGIVPGSLVNFQDADGLQRRGKVLCVLHDYREKAVIFSDGCSWVIDLEQCSLHAACVGDSFYDTAGNGMV